MSDYIEHYGIKGQKWGVRRYQNEDGSLTDAGKARVAKNASEYLPSSRKSSKELYKTIKFDKKGGIKSGDNRHRLAEQYAEDDADHTYAESKKKYDSLKTQWASATLKDLNMKDTSAGRNAIKSILKDIDPNYNYRHRYPKEDKDVLSDSELKEYKKRKDILAHPTREKIKSGVEKVKKAVDFVSSVKNWCLKSRLKRLSR